MSPVDRPDWDEPTALVPSAESHAVLPGDPTSAFADANVERRYRTMVAGRMAKASLPADEARKVLDPSLAAEWDSTGGFAMRLVQAQRGAVAILERLAPDDRSGFIAEFDALPEGARSALFSEIALGSSGSVRSASDDAVARFAATPEGGALVKEWGHQANRNVAVIRDRINRIIERMTAEDIDVATVWFDALPPAAAKAIYRMLASQ